jgi:2-oxoglutarate ferredoxin oxidoreductase subunit alpha
LSSHARRSIAAKTSSHWRALLALRPTFGKHPKLDTHKVQQESRDGKANEIALKTGYNFADTTEVFTTHYTVKKAKIAPASIEVNRKRSDRNGFIAASQLSGRPLFYGSYPITPASDILHELSRHKSFGVKTFQAEDEIAAVCAQLARASQDRLV